MRIEKHWQLHAPWVCQLLPYLSLFCWFVEYMIRAKISQNHSLLFSNIISFVLEQKKINQGISIERKNKITHTSNPFLSRINNNNWFLCFQSNEMIVYFVSFIYLDVVSVRFLIVSLYFSIFVFFIYFANRIAKLWSSSCFI